MVDTTASDYVVTLASLNRVEVVKDPRAKKTDSDRVVTITGINVTLVGNAIIASYYVVIITSIDGRKVFDTNLLLKLFISKDYVFSIAGIYKSSVADAVTT
jgi:hypothetical protein